MPRSPQRRAKDIGYALEHYTEKMLQAVFPRLRRTGSPNYKAHAPDLVQDGAGPVIFLVVTRDAHQGVLVTLSLGDFLEMNGVYPGEHRVYPRERQVAVQCKYRQSTWVGTLYRALKTGGGK